MLIEAIQGRGRAAGATLLVGERGWGRGRMTHTCVRAEGRADGADTGTLVHLVVAG